MYELKFEDRVVFEDGSPDSYDLMEKTFGEVIRSYSSKKRMKIVQGDDHTFSPPIFYRVFYNEKEFLEVLHNLNFPYLDLKLKISTKDEIRAQKIKNSLENALDSLWE